MSHQHPPTPDPHGGPPDGEDDGTLLFDPNTPAPDLDFPEPERDPSGPSKGMTLGLVLVGLVVVVGGGLLLTGGSDDDTEAAEAESIPAEVSPAAAPTLEPVPQDSAGGPVGSTVTVGVRALDGRGVPVADSVVLFTVERGDGTLEFPEARTTSDGIAASRVLLPEQPGRTVIRAEIPGWGAVPATILVDATAGAPAEMLMAGGNGQEAEIGELLENRVFVLVRDTAGNPVPNAEVRFRIDAGDGVTAPSQTRTDSLGRASALWRLGMAEGMQRLVAISSDLLSTVTFTATALPRVTLDEEEGEPDETAPVTVRPNSFVVGGSHVCSLSSGTLSCRGGNDRGQTAGQGADRFVALAAGASHTCALEANGSAACWGGNERGQLGDGSRSDRAQPTRVRTELRFSTLVAGAAHTCGLAGAGVPLCWGLNVSGQLGDGSRNDQTVPQTVGSGISFRSLAAGWNHTCGITANGNAFCWGQNNQGQLGDGSQLDRLVPTLVRGAVETLVAGSAHTCGISEGQVLCWGGNSFGQLGDGTTDERSQPAPVAGLPGRPTHLAAGAVHSCALVQGGQAYCWGQNLQGQLGDGSTENRNRAVAVVGGRTYREIHAGGAQTCATTTAGEEYCWGLNLNGQLGDGTRVSRSTPTRVTN